MTVTVTVTVSVTVYLTVSVTVFVTVYLPVCMHLYLCVMSASVGICNCNGACLHACLCLRVCPPMSVPVSALTIQRVSVTVAGVPPCLPPPPHVRACVCSHRPVRLGDCSRGSTAGRCPLQQQWSRGPQQGSHRQQHTAQTVLRRRSVPLLQRRLRRLSPRDTGSDDTR